MAHLDFWALWLSRFSDLSLVFTRLTVAVGLLLILRRVKLPFHAAAVSFIVLAVSRGGVRALDSTSFWQFHPLLNTWARGENAVVSIVAAVLWMRAIPSIIRLVTTAATSEAQTTELTKKNELIETLLQASPDPTLAFDKECRFTVWNLAMERLIGYPQAKVLGRPVLEIFPDLVERGVYAHYLRTLEGTAFHVDDREFTNRTTGQKGWYESQWTPLKSKSGDVVGGLCMARDITEKRENAHTVARQQGQLIESAKLKALGEMAAGMAHEINTPAATIVLKARELAGLRKDLGPQAEMVTAISEKIAQTAMRIGHIIHSLRTFARESSRDPFETVEIGHLLRETLNLCENRFKMNQIDLKIEIAEQLKIECRPSEIIQVLINLLNNSFDALAQSESRLIRISASEDNEMVRLAVMDNGPGVPPEMLPKLMQPFATSKGVGKGTGLGLSISKGIVEAHGGRLTLDGPQGFTTFSVWLPKMQLDPKA